MDSALFVGVYLSARLYWKTSWVPLPAIDFFSGGRE